MAQDTTGLPARQQRLGVPKVRPINSSSRYDKQVQQGRIWVMVPFGCLALARPLQKTIMTA